MSQLIKVHWVLIAVLSVIAAVLAGCSATGSGKPGNSRGVIQPTATTVPLFADTNLPDPLDVVPEPQLTGIDGWINSPELRLKELAAQNRVVLLDFWTYSCVNCVRTFPFLNAMHERYTPHGLTVIGVHSPEFEFEKVRSNVEQAVRRWGLRYAVALDSDKETWSSFGNHFWPTTYLLDAGGEVVYRHFGEGGYEDTEFRVRQALEQAGADLTGISAGGDFGPPVTPNAHTRTREIYAGYRHGYESAGLFAAQPEYYQQPEVVVDYSDEGLRKHGQFELNGKWLNQADSIVFEGDAPEGEGYVVLPVLATSVNVVMSPPPGISAGAVVQVQLNGKSIPRGSAGADVTYDGSGRSLVNLDLPRMYSIIEGGEFELAEVKLIVSSRGVKVYNFTFGVSSEGP